MIKSFVFIIAIFLGGAIATAIDVYTEISRENYVMGSCESRRLNFEIPQPKEFNITYRIENSPVECRPVSGNICHNQQAGPLRRLVGWFKCNRPIKRLFGRLCGKC